MCERQREHLRVAICESEINKLINFSDILGHVPEHLGRLENRISNFVCVACKTKSQYRYHLSQGD